MFQGLINCLLPSSAAEEHARLRSADIDKELAKARKSDFGKGARGLEDHKALDKAPKGSQVSLMLLLVSVLLRKVFDLQQSTEASISGSI